MSTTEENKENSEIFDLIINDDLKKTGLFECATFNRRTEIIEVFVNHKINGSINWTLNRKNWTKNFELFWEQVEEYGITDNETKLLCRRLLNHNQKEILKSSNENENGNNGGGDNNKNKEQKNLYPIFKYSQGTPLMESILVENIPYFIAINDGNNNNKEPIFCKKHPLSAIDIIPPERTEYLSKAYSFESVEEIHKFVELAKNQTLDSLLRRVKGILKKYIDIDDDFINVVAADIVFTYFQDRLGMTHYLLIVGDNNTGKSNILLVFSILGYRSILDTSITPANIYNFGSQLEEGQHTILEDELGDIDEQLDKKKMYQVSYRTGTHVTRMYESNFNNNSPGNSARKSSRQQQFFLYCFKMFATEKLPHKVKSKGFLERLIPLKVVPGNPLYDIAEVIDNSGDKKLHELNQELEDTRKLLFIYRLLHHKDSIPDVKLNIKNRYKQLTKPLIRLFQNSESLQEIIKSLSKYLIEKNKEKIDSLDSAILNLIIELVKEKGTTRLFNKEIWDKIVEVYPEGEIEDKKWSWYIDGCGTISKNKLTETCEDKFGAVKHRDEAIGRGLIFNLDTLNKVSENYSIIEGIQIIKQQEDEKGEEKE
jgi:hypothetical protein